MAQIQRGETFVDGQVVNAARLNNLVDLAIALDGLILNQTHLATAISNNDQIILWDDNSGSLRRATVAAFLATTIGVTSVGLTMPAATFNQTGSNPITTTGTFNVTWQVQSANTVLCGPASGGTGTPAFRVLNVGDITLPGVAVAASTIDWSLGSVFTKSLTANTTFTFTNANFAQTILVKLVNTASHPVTWPAGVQWPGGIGHTMTAGVNKTDLCTFRYINGVYYGTFDKNFMV